MSKKNETSSLREQIESGAVRMTRSQIFEAVARGDLTAEEAMTLTPASRGKVYMSDKTDAICVHTGRRFPASYYAAEWLRILSEVPAILEHILDVCNDPATGFKDSAPREVVRALAEKGLAAGSVHDLASIAPPAPQRKG